MGDRIRFGEILAAIGSVGLAVLLAIGTWYEFDSSRVAPKANAGDSFAPTAEFVVSGGAGSSHLGWFVLVLAIAAAASSLWFLFRSATSRTTERPLLQGPVAYTFTLLALFAVGLRLLLGDPTYGLDGSDLEPGIGQIELPLDVAPGGWVGLFLIYLLLVGLWVSMSDERTDSRGARERTARLLAGVTPRPAPVAGVAAPGPAVAAPGAAAAAKSDAAVVADDAVSTDLPDDSSTSPSGGPA